MSKLPVLLGMSLWLMLGTCKSATVVKRFLPGYPSPGYRPTFPWENFFKKSNDVSSSEYSDGDVRSSEDVDNDVSSSEDVDNDVSSSEDVDSDDSSETSVDTTNTGKIYDSEDLFNTVYEDDQRLQDTDVDVNPDYINDSDIDDMYIGDSDIDDSDNDDSGIVVTDDADHGIDTHDFDDGDIDYSDNDDFDADYNPVHEDGYDPDQKPLSDHLSYHPLEDEYSNDELDHFDKADDDILDRDRRAVRPWMLKYVPATLKGIMARNYLLKGAIPTPARNHGITKHFEKPGGQTAMTKDFYLVQPTKVSDAMIDDHYVGKIGQVGDTRLHFFIHDHEHVDLRPFMSIQKMDKFGNVIEKDIIHYMD